MQEQAAPELCVSSRTPLDLFLSLWNLAKLEREIFSQRFKLKTFVSVCIKVCCFDCFCSLHCQPCVLIQWASSAPQNILYPNFDHATWSSGSTFVFPYYVASSYWETGFVSTRRPFKISGRRGFNFHPNQPSEELPSFSKLVFVLVLGEEKTRKWLWIVCSIVANDEK